MAYKWTFENVGGATRVRVMTGEDIRHLGELDQKMWTVLSCPASGLEIDTESLSLMDIDGDGQLRLVEVVKTAEWLCSVLKDPDVLFRKSDTLSLDEIADEAILAVAKKVAGEANEVSLAPVNAAIDAVAITPAAVPAAPYEADVMAMYKSKQGEIAAYYELAKMAKLGLAVIPEETVAPAISEKEFTAMGAKIADYEAGVKAAADTDAAALAAGKAEYADLRKLLLLSRDFVTLLRNFVTLEDFYKREADQMAIFQAGTLVIDQRACRLCIRVNDMGKQDAQAGASGMFLIYCDCHSKKLGQSMKIVAGVTMGEIKNLKVGKNAVFYDRQGNDWDATITKVVDNPISIRQAFWSPYRKFGNWVTELINKSAAEKNDKAFADMTAQAQQSTAALTDGATPEKKQAFDIAKFAGIFAAIGMAIGFIGEAIVSLAGGINETPWWKLLIWIAAIMLVISGPAMIMAWIKLRRRNLAPILNANGWAVNADTLISVPFGITLTEQVQFPFIKLTDPFAKKGMPAWKKALIWCAVIIGLAGIAALVLWFFGLWPFNQCVPVTEAVETATDVVTAAVDSVAVN